jgi:hypothetical protein
VSEAEQTWERMVNTPLMGDLSGLAQEQREQAKFVQLVRDRAGGKEVMKDGYRHLVGIARKPP